MFRWILDDTRALIRDVRSVGRRLSSRWQWFRLRSRRRLDGAATGLENVRRSAEARTRMCSHCRALIPATARTCPECGEAPGRPVSRGLGRVLENMAPGIVSVTSVLLTLNMVVYVVCLLASARVQASLPSDVRSGAWVAVLDAIGANAPFLVGQGEIWRLLTYIFLHGNLLHLLMNSWALLAVGPFVEETHGPHRLLFLYLSTGAGAGFASFLWRGGAQGDMGPGVGASGSIFGLIGVAAVWGWRRGGSVGEGVRGMMMQWAIYGLVMGVLIRADNAAHLGGLVAGALLSPVVGEKDRVRGLPARLWEVVSWLCAIVIMASFAMVALRYEANLVLIVDYLLSTR